MTNKRDRDLNDEIESHLRMAAQDRLARGASRQEAEAAARRELGNAGLIKEVDREVNGPAAWERFFQDLRYGLRRMLHNRVVSVVSILTLALGIGASTAIFSVVYGVLLRPLPYDKADKIVRLYEQSSARHQMNFADPNFDDLHSQNQSFLGMAEYQFDVEAVAFNNEARQMETAAVSHDFLDVMGVHPVIGRSFLPEEQQLNAAPVALVSYSFWQQNLGSRTDLGALQIKVANKPVPVVGVLPAGFHFPDNTDVWTAREIWPKYTSRNSHNFRVIGRLKDDRSVIEATSELGGMASRIKATYGRDVEMSSVDIEPLREDLTRDVRPALLVLLAVAGLLLLVACANVMNLMLAQAAARKGELAVRTALGASQSRLIRQFLAESLLLCLAGGAAGVMVAYIGVPVLLRAAPSDLPRLQEVEINFPVLVFAIVLSAIVAASLGVFTALRATAGDPQAGLAEGGRAHQMDSSSERAGRLIIGAQLAVTMLLLVGAGLLGRSMLRVLAVNPGFRTEDVVVLDLALANGSDKPHRVQFVDKVLSSLRALPSVNSAGGSNALPLQSDGFSNGTFAVVNPQQFPPQTRALIERSSSFTVQPNQADLKALEDFFSDLFRDPSHNGYADYAAVSDGYFEALAVPLRQGRLFTPDDGPDSQQVAIVSESLARRMWPGENPLGRSIEFGNMDGDLRPLTIVGVVGDVREASIEAAPKATVYVNSRQRPQSIDHLDIAIYGRLDKASTLNSARRIIHELDPEVPVNLSTFDAIVTKSLSSREFNLVLMGVFTVTALVLAMVGIYGVLAYWVARRTREIGVRMALGASADKVVRLVLRNSMVTAAAGVAAGLLTALMLTRLMRSLLYGISAADPLTYVVAGSLLILVALVATLLPARRAAQVDPMIALRHE